MKKKALKKMFCGIMCALMLLALVGCESSELGEKLISKKNDTSLPASNVCVVISPTANQHKPDVSLAYNELYDSCYSYGYKSCVVDDGAPFVAFEEDLTKEDRPDGLSEQNRKLDAEAYVNSFVDKTAAVQALTAEKDTIKSIRLAADCLADCKGDKTIVLVDNGISTAGVESFKTFRGFDVDECIDALSDNDYPELDNIRVVWYSLGDTVNPQAELSNNDIINLQGFWEKYLRNAGASDVTFPKKVAVNTTDDSSALPWVSTVEVTPTVSKTPDFKAIMEQVDTMPEEEKNNTLDAALENGLKLDETSVRFEPDSFELTDKEAAINIMSPLADYLNKNVNKRIVLLGTTATCGSNESCVAFSLGRAETLKKIMVSDMNVAPTQLLTVGLGYENDFHINDLNTDGTLNTSVAPMNRSVIFVDADSNTGRRYS